MPVKWIQTKYKGVRFYEHPIRKHGIQRDKYFAIRYQKDKKRKEEGLGWMSEGWTLEKALAELVKLKEASVKGEGPTRLSEKRDAEERRKMAEQEEQERLEREAINFDEFFTGAYSTWINDNKVANTVRMEKALYKRWVKESIGLMPLNSVAPIHLEKIKKTLSDKGRSPKTVHHVLSLIRQVFNFAKRQGLFSGDHPVSKVKMPRIDNAKLRYLVPDEISLLLNALEPISDIVRDQALLSVNCGLRFSEVAGLRWEDVNYETGSLSIRDAKTGSRTVFMNNEVRKTLQKRQGKHTVGLVFPDEQGHRQARISKTFQRTADKLFNKDISDRRLRVSFHTLRHTFGTLLYSNSGDLYLTQKALGHQTILMAQRYAKMTEPKLRDAFNLVDKAIKRKNTIQANDTKLDKLEKMENLPIGCETDG